MLRQRRQRPYRSRASWGATCCTQDATGDRFCAILSKQQGYLVRGCGFHVARWVGPRSWMRFDDAWHQSRHIWIRFWRFVARFTPFNGPHPVSATCVRFRTYWIPGLWFEIGKYRPSPAYGRLVQKSPGPGLARRRRRDSPVLASRARRISSRT